MSSQQNKQTNKHPIVQFYSDEVAKELSRCDCCDCDPCDYEAS